MAGMRQDWLNSSCSTAGRAELLWARPSADEPSAPWQLLALAGLIRCLVRACSTSQPEAVDPVPKPVPFAQYSCCSSLVPAP
ncbi:hypothetical protein EYF80_048352 [Liparis tanakae]|uniref:Uncharacterized protein n=1 Tax=Liparis tanakae TaxID=230148 RepID=A0A4Z2FL43_9TELE|nr:hypothetical protein EYF80_048352 [Liparis tanakae]